MTRWHMCLNVRGFLRNQRFPRGYRGVFRHDDGRIMTPDEARNHLFDELARGHELIPIGDCDNFDHSTNGGCRGHETGLGGNGPHPASGGMMIETIEWVACSERLPERG